MFMGLLSILFWDIGPYLFTATQITQVAQSIWIALAGQLGQSGQQ